ncbi:hypothetical protein [Rhodococcus erythropolis]
MSLLIVIVMVLPVVGRVPALAIPLNPKVRAPAARAVIAATT